MSGLNDPSVIAHVLTQCRTIAVVGMSADRSRDSYQIGQYLQRHGYRIVPVNPTYAGTSILGELCYSSLQKAEQALSAEGGHIELVDCFRRADAMEPIAADAIEIGAQCLWMQFGVINQAAVELAEAAGLAVVMDRCIKVEHADL